MTWIRNPWWDGFWILSGVWILLPIVLMVVYAPSALFGFFAVAIVLETAHNISPIETAWANQGFRRLMLKRQGKFVWLPVAIMLVCLGVGAATSLGWTSYRPGWSSFYKLTDWRNPFPVMLWAYWTWQLYHFGMQNYGMLRLYTRKMPTHTWQRREDGMTVCCAITLIGMWLLPALAQSQRVSFICIGLFSFGHWMQAIGLCSAVSKRTWMFIVAMGVLGTLGFSWEWAYSCEFAVSVSWTWPYVHEFPVRCPPFLIERAGVSPRDFYFLLGLRTGIGFVHFLYDRWIWKLSDPQVRATIGAGLFREARA